VGSLGSCTGLVSTAIARLEVAKAEAVAVEDYGLAGTLKGAIDKAKTLLERVSQLEAQKKDAAATEDYVTAAAVKSEIDAIIARLARCCPSMEDCSVEQIIASMMEEEGICKAAGIERRDEKDFATTAAESARSAEDDQRRQAEAAAAAATVAAAAVAAEEDRLRKAAEDEQRRLREEEASAALAAVTAENDRLRKAAEDEQRRIRDEETSAALAAATAENEHLLKVEEERARRAAEDAQRRLEEEEPAAAKVEEDEPSCQLGMAQAAADAAPDEDLPEWLREVQQPGPFCHVPATTLDAAVSEPTTKAPPLLSDDDVPEWLREIQQPRRLDDFQMDAWKSPSHKGRIESEIALPRCLPSEATPELVRRTDDTKLSTADRAQLLRDGVEAVLRVDDQVKLANWGEDAFVKLRLGCSPALKILPSGILEGEAKHAREVFSFLLMFATKGGRFRLAQIGEVMEVVFISVPWVDAWRNSPELARRMRSELSDEAHAAIAAVVRKLR